jgi:hypothetical protein
MARSSLILVGVFYGAAVAERQPATTGRYDAGHDSDVAMETQRRFTAKPKLR